MFNSYEAVYRYGMLQWIGEKPEEDNLHVIVTVLKKTDKKFQEDIEQLLHRTRGIVRPSRSKDEIDSDIAAIRNEWERAWNL